MPEELHVALDVNGLGEWVADSIPDSFTIMTDDEVNTNLSFGVDSRIEITRLNGIIRRLTNGYNNTLRNAVERTEEHDGCRAGKYDFINGINFSWRPTRTTVRIVGSVNNVVVSNPFGDSDSDDAFTEWVTEDLPTYIDGEYVEWEVTRD